MILVQYDINKYSVVEVQNMFEYVKKAAEEETVLFIPNDYNVLQNISKSWLMEFRKTLDNIIDNMEDDNDL